MSFFLALCLLADGGTPPEGGVELTVYRSARELPAEWVKLLPADFDFRKEMLATRARPGERLAWTSARLERQGADVYLTAPPPPVEEPRECAPCRGVHTEDTEPVKRVAPGPAVPAFRVVKARGKVFLLPAPELRLVARRQCPPCTAP